jgi:hypothetical protein
MNQTSTCLSPLCGSTVEGDVARCPQCGGRMRTPRDVHRAGWVLVVLGMFLIGFIGAILWYLAPALLTPGVAASSGATFTGTPEQAQMIFTLFGAVIVFAFAILINGVVQIATGQRNRVLIGATLVLAAGLIVYAVVTARALG